ncbi:hypothetical protein TNCV_2405921 [Trichonephila clavipes]|nr:hypothetical protein TNCV_2405921 [Trichonephila clavipes]
MPLIIGDEEDIDFQMVDDDNVLFVIHKLTIIVTPSTDVTLPSLGAKSMNAHQRQKAKLASQMFYLQKNHLLKVPADFPQHPMLIISTNSHGLWRTQDISPQSRKSPK